MLNSDVAETEITATRHIDFQGYKNNLESLFPDNSINSSRYSKWGFLPKILIVQFMNPMNLWFLFISILELSTLNENITVNVGTVLPLLILIVIEVAIELCNDFSKSSSDRTVNSAECQVWVGDTFKIKYFKDILVGDLILLTNNSIVPADIIILASGNTEHECYMEASTILGESSLKIKHAVRSTQLIIDTLNVSDACLRLKLLDGNIEVSLPNPGFKDFSGRLKLKNSPKSVPLLVENLLYRGSKITNTPWIFALVVYTGLETKAWINNSITKTKKSKLQVLIDKWSISMLPFIMIVCIINTIAYAKSRNNLPYSWNNVLISNVILFGHSIPITLSLSILLIRIFLRMFHQSQLNVKINSPALFTDLGMVEYIVADKTGTITENKLKIVFCIIADTIYWDDERSQEELEFDNSPTKTLTIQALANDDKFSSLRNAIIQEQACSDSRILNFVTCMAVCNLAFRDEADYVAISVDDKELARTAASLGVKLQSRTADMCILSMFDNDTVFEVLGFQQFSSLNKKSRIVLRNVETGKIVLYVKGSRDMMMSLYSEDHIEDETLEGYRTIYMGYKPMTGQEGKNFYQEYLTAKQSPINKEDRIEAIFEKYEKKLEYLGLVGLEDQVNEETRKAVRMLKRAGIKFWLLSGDSESSTLSAALAAEMYQLNEPVLSLSNLTSELDFLNVVQEYIQQGIFECQDEIFNAESINNQTPEEQAELLQNEVFHKPGLDTHRSSDTSKTVQYKKIITFRNSQSILGQDTEQKKKMIAKARNRTVNPLVSHLPVRKRKTRLRQMYSPDKINFVLSIDSSGLEYALRSRVHTKYFISLIFAARFVCFHSLFPDNKTKVVQILKNSFSFKPMVLSVGDGTSDIGMIQAADVGVGIYGKEGNDAANSSDVAINHFSQLGELLLRNGHMQYVQVSKMVLISFYAMVLIEAEIFMLNIVAGFTGSSLIQKEFVVIYRLVASIIPISGMCMFDQDSVTTKITPQAFKAGIFNSILTKKNLVSYCVFGILQAFLTFIMIYCCIKGSSPQGFTESLLMVGSSIMIIILCTLLISVYIETYNISLRVAAFHLLNSLVLIVILVPISYTDTGVEGYLTMLGEYKTVWVCIVFTVLVNVTVSYFFKVLRHVVFPGVLEIVRKAKPDLTLKSKTRLENYRKSLKNVFRDSSVLNNNIVHDSEKVNKWKMKFVSEYREKLYQADKIMENLGSFKIVLLVAGGGSIAFALYHIGLNKGKPSYIVYLIVSSLLIMLFSILPQVKNLRIYTGYYFSIFLILTQLFFFMSSVLFNNLHVLDIYCYVPVLYLIGFSNHWLEISISSLLTLGFIIPSLILYVLNFSLFAQIDDFISYFIIYTSICILASTASYIIDKSRRLEFNLVQKVQVEVQKAKNVLSYLLPAFVRKRVKDGARNISESQGIATIIFCDIYNFEDLLQNYNPQELTVFMDELFAKFDQKCTISGCTKIETVGKTYMASAGLKDTESDIDQYFSNVSHARRCVEMGISIINLCENMYLKNGETLKVKIGINTGIVTAGVVGFHKPQFSLVGDTVNTASRMASLCPGANMIQISQDSYHHMRDLSGLYFLPSTIVAKGKGEMKTFLVSIEVKQINGSNSSFAISETAVRNRNSKKLTMYQLSAFNKESGNKRRSSVLENLNDVVLDGSNEFVKHETQMVEEIKLVSFGCKESNKETAFRKEFSDTNFNLSKAGLMIRIVCDLVFLTLSVIRAGVEFDIEVYTIIKLILELLVLLMLFMKFNECHKRLSFCWCLNAAYLLGGALRLIDFNQDPEIRFVDYLLYLLQAALCTQLLFNSLSWSLTCTLVFQITLCSVFTHYQQLISGVTFLSTLLFVVYHRERRLRVFSRIKSSAEKELIKNEELLTKMMPKNVLDRLKEQNNVAEQINGVTILYADISGFTQWSSDKLPDEVVSMLSNLFTEFDHKCVEYDIYKVHTIGDCYVALGYTGDKVRSVHQECCNLAEFALQLVEAIKEVNRSHRISLGMRIGVHTGSIIGGIAGTNIVRYDIYGEDVLMANKMESSGVVGKVHISHSTMNILHKHYPHKFIFSKADPVESPVTKELTETYFLDYVPQ